MSGESDTLRSMVLSFRMSELHTLLVFAGKSKSGRKTEIQSRALDLVKVNSADIKLKIKELSNAMYKSLGTAASVNPYSSNYSGSAPSPAAAVEPPSPASPPTPTPPPPRPATPDSPPAPKEKDKRKDKNRDRDEDDEEEDSSPPAKEKTKGRPKGKKKAAAKERIIIPPDTSPAMGRSRRTAALVASASLSNLYRESEKDFERDLIEREEEAEKLANASRATRKSTKAAAIAAATPTEASSTSTSTTTTTTTTASSTSKTATSSSNSSSSSTTVTNATTPSTTTLPVASAGPLGLLSSSAHTSTTLDSIISALSSAAALATTTTSTTTAPAAFPSSQTSIPTASVAPSVTTPLNSYLPPVHRGITGYINANGRPTSLVQSMYSSMPGYNTHSSSVRQESSLTYPPMPDVKLLKLPFYKVLSVLMKPSALQPSGSARFQEQKFSFYLSPHQAGEILDSCFRDSSGRPDYKRQIQMRFSLLETSCEQDDNFPASICVKVNHKLQPLPNPIPTNKPGVEPKRPPKPINITQLCKLSATLANYIDVSWAVEIGRGYTVSVYYVDKLATRDLMKELKDRGSRHPDFTRALIKEKLNDKDSDIATTSCKVTLACPLGKMRMSYPCRSNTCDHLQCFDANLYVMMNERRPKWLCPVCNKTALYDNLLIDGYFTEILKSKRLPPDDHEIVLHNDGTWDPLPPPKKDNGEESGSSGPRKTVAEKIQASVSSSSAEPSNGTNGNTQKPEKVETFSVDDDDDEEATKTEGKDESNGNNDGASGETKPDKKRPIDCITLDSESDTDSDPPLGIPATKRSRPTAFLDDDDDDSEPAVPTPPEAANVATTAAPAAATTAAAANPAVARKADDIICIDDD